MSAISVPTQQPTAVGDGPRVPSTGTLLGVLGAVVAAFVFVWLIGLDLGVRPPLPARIQADGIVVLVSLVGDLGARLASVLALGALTGYLFFGRDEHLRALAGRAAQVWFVAAILNTVANPAYVTGVPLGAVLRLDAWWTFLLVTPSAMAWLASALVAFGVVVAAYTRRDAGVLALLLLGGVLAQVFVAATGNVTVGLDHDWATDAAIVGTLAFMPLALLAVGAWLSSTAEAVRRYHRAVPGLVIVWAVATAAIGWQQLADQPVTSQFYGVALLGFAGVQAWLLISWGVRQISAEANRAASRRGWSVARDVMLIVAALAFAAAENHIPPPRFLEPQNISINYLGYEVLVEPTLSRLFLLGRPNVLWVAILVVAIGAYLIGMRKVRSHGGRWPTLRLVAWSAAWLLTGYLAVSGLWEYSTVMYSWHMVVHMTVNMLVPVLAVLGGPLTLIRQASGPDAAPGSMGGVVDAVESSRVWQVMTSPPVAWVAYVGSLFAVYFTPLFPWLMRYHWAHQLMLLFFMMTGYFFFNLIIGHDRTSYQLPHLVKLALVISIMPFHALFAVGVLSSKSLIGASFYETLAIGWLPDLMADQNVAGQATWLLGEVPLFIVMLALAAQWFRSDAREAEQIDTATDSGDDDSFDAYNDMLAELARRDAADRRAEVLRRHQP